jgi:hypothetical protein
VRAHFVALAPVRRKDDSLEDIDGLDERRNEFDAFVRHHGPHVFCPGFRRYALELNGIAQTIKDTARQIQPP